MVIWVIFSLIEKLGKPKKLVFGGSASGIPRQGIIFTVGRQVDTISYSINGINPKYVGFVCTTETINFIKTAVCISGFTEETSKYEIVNPIDINDIRIKTNLIIDWMLNKELANKDIALDPTGGLTTMSLGAYSATYERNIDSQYVRSRYDENNKPIANSQELMLLNRYFDTE